ncbi:MAG: hypothetical protein M3296_10015, partial [Actinomycetota bacterium]|nr:hypothetical protein [Actinomycetota bacterium]
MSRPIVAWGLAMAVLGALNVTVFAPGGPRSPALLFGIAGFMVLLGALLWLSGRDTSPPEVAGALPTVSPPAACLGVGLVLLALGAAVGPWLVWMGGGVTLVGAAGLARELRAQRRA